MKQQEIENRFGAVILEFPICRLNWEMDGKGWIVKNPDGSTQLVLTNHGQPYVAQIRELQELEHEYDKYKQCLQDAKQLLSI